jgi:hypothetical protein
MKNKIILVTLFFHSITFALTCTDDYIISGGRAIDLLQDNPFQIIEKDTELIVIREKFIIKFINPQIIDNGKYYIKRYSLKYINDDYYFDIYKINDDYKWHWEQYAAGSSKRGFGGVCLN